MTNKPNSGAEILDNLQGVMSDAQMGRGDLTYIGAPKSKKRERDLSAYTAVAALIAERNALRALCQTTHAFLTHGYWGTFDYMEGTEIYEDLKKHAALLALATTPTQDKANDQQAE